ncbi:MAG: hypothetical protein JNK82_31500 [Myxococcaceae bacterium]|nr:hypothetical protein [Myxococcaceae bacterium]
MPTRLTLFAIVGLASGCAPTPREVPDPSLDGPKTWSGVIGPLVATRCGICHRGGDIAPFPLELYAQVKLMGPSVLAAVETRSMPPFPPEQSDESGCPRVDDIRRMSDAEREVLIAWLKDGMPEGEPGKEPTIPTNEPLGPPSDQWQMSEEYVSASDAPDDYRCIIIDPKVVTSIPVGAVSVKPGNRKVVHHSAVYLVPPEQANIVRRLDADEPGPGYTCFGGVGVAEAYPTGIWVPGNDAPLVPPHGGVGYYLLPGWVFVVQQHYNYSGGKSPDRSTVVLWRANTFLSEVPHSLVTGTLDFSIPPMAMGHTVSSDAIIVPGGQTAAVWNEANEGRVYSVWAHQHQLGRSFSMELVRPDGSTQCLLKIPRWDFNWQSIYRLKSFVDVKPGDKVRTTCTWDNPRTSEVHYGEGTADEMCLGSLALLK